MSAAFLKVLMLLWLFILCELRGRIVWLVWGEIQTLVVGLKPRPLGEGLMKMAKRFRVPTSSTPNAPIRLIDKGAGPSGHDLPKGRSRPPGAPPLSSRTTLPTPAERGRR